jgi:hypothetical protein
MVKPKAKCYEYFEDARAVEGSKVLRRKCKHCGNTSSDKKERLLSHLRKCKVFLKKFTDPKLGFVPLAIYNPEDLVHASASASGLYFYKNVR